MSEPRVDDDIALDKDGECDNCGNFIFECVCNTPDEPYDVVYADQYPQKILRQYKRSHTYICQPYRYTYQGTDQAR